MRPKLGGCNMESRRLRGEAVSLLPLARQFPYCCCLAAARRTPLARRVARAGRRGPMRAPRSGASQCPRSTPARSGRAPPVGPWEPSIRWGRRCGIGSARHTTRDVGLVSRGNADCSRRAGQLSAGGRAQTLVPVTHLGVITDQATRPCTTAPPATRAAPAPLRRAAMRAKEKPGGSQRRGTDARGSAGDPYHRARARSRPFGDKASGKGLGLGRIEPQQREKEERHRHLRQLTRNDRLRAGRTRSILPP